METAQFLETELGPLFMIATGPQDSPKSAVVCSGGWYVGATNANRVLVRLSRAISAMGYRSARFDWHGAGQSPGDVERFSLSEPFGDDVVAVARSLGGSSTLVGVCFGSRCALEAAQHIDDLEAIVLVSFPFPVGGTRAKRADQLGVRDAVRSAFRPEVLKSLLDPNSRRLYWKWVTLKWRAVKRRIFPSSAAPAKRIREKVADQTMSIPQLVREVHALVQRDVRVLFLYGDSDGHYDHFAKSAEDGPLAKLLERAGDRITVRPVTGDLSGFATMESQDRMITEITDWLGSHGQ